MIGSKRLCARCEKNYFIQTTRQHSICEQCHKKADVLGAKKRVITLEKRKLAHLNYGRPTGKFRDNRLRNDQ